MKHILTILILSFISFECFAQMHISTNMRRDAIFNETTKEYDLVSEDKEELTFFEFNKDFTMFKHTSPTITSSYIIKSSIEDKENERWEFEIMSDVGNKYHMVIDLKNNNIRFIYIKNGSTYLVQHTIKKLWFDNEINIDKYFGELTDPSNLKLPSACELLSKQNVKKLFNIKSDINIKDASSDDPSMGQSCFFKWDDINTPNAGILVQVFKNPVYYDYPEYIADFIKTKLLEGELIEGNDDVIEYLPFNLSNKLGAYSFKQARFYWTGGSNYLFMLAFNVSTLSEENMVIAAKKLINEINENFISNLK